MCPFTSFVISNMLTLFLPLKTLGIQTGPSAKKPNELLWRFDMGSPSRLEDQEFAVA